MAKQGKCSFCRKRYIWKKDVKIMDCRCPACGDRLLKTTQNNYLPIVEISEPAYVYRYTETERAIDRELEKLTGRIVE